MKNRRIEVLKIESIFYASYQRQLNERRAKMIAKQFKNELFKQPVVAFREGKYFCVDGQHTIAAFKILGKDVVACTVFDSDSFVEESELFLTLNRPGLVRGKTCTPYECYVVGISVEDKHYMTIKHAAESNNIRITGQKCSQHDVLIAIGNALEIVKTLNNLDETLAFICRCWPTDPVRLNADMLAGVSRSLKSIDNERCIKKLKKYSCEEIFAKATQIAFALGQRKMHVMPSVLKNLSGIEQ
jgi:hypothetical protein